MTFFRVCLLHLMSCGQPEWRWPTSVKMGAAYTKARQRQCTNCTAPKSACWCDTHKFIGRKSRLQLHAAGLGSKSAASAHMTSSAANLLHASLLQICCLLPHYSLHCKSAACISTANLLPLTAWHAPPPLQKLTDGPFAHQQLLSGSPPASEWLFTCFKSPPASYRWSKCIMH